MRTPLSRPALLRTTLAVAVVAVMLLAAWALAGRDNNTTDAAVQSPPTSQRPVPSIKPSGTPGSLPSAAVSSTTTALPSSSGPAAVARGRGSFPSADTTGIPAGARLKAVTSAPLRVSKAGAVIDGADIRADISVEADNVTIKNSRVMNAGEWGIIQRPGVKGLTVQDSEIRGNGTDRLQHAIFNLGGQITIIRNDMSVVSDAISTSVGLVEDNFLHDPIYFDGDHTDMIQANSGPPPGQQLVIRHNTVINTLEQTAAVALFQDFGVQHDAVIERNLLAGGGYALYAGAGKKGTSYNIKVISNVFSREVHATGGRFGPVAYWDHKGSGNVWRGNVWADTGRPVTP